MNDHSTKIRKTKLDTAFINDLRDFQAANNITSPININHNKTTELPTPEENSPTPFPTPTPAVPTSTPNDDIDESKTY